MTVKLSDIIREYGSAMRYDWSQMDGKSISYDMDEIAKYIEEDCLFLEDDDARSLRLSLGICPEGNGCWLEYCAELCHHD